jgi:hypothetical protein
MNTLPPKVTLTFCPQDQNGQTDQSNCHTATIPVYSPSGQQQQQAASRTPVFVGCERGNIGSVRILEKGGYQIGCVNNSGEPTGTISFVPSQDTPLTGLIFMPK